MPRFAWLCLPFTLALWLAPCPSAVAEDVAQPAPTGPFPAIAPPQVVHFQAPISLGLLARERSLTHYLLAERERTALQPWAQALTIALGGAIIVLGSVVPEDPPDAFALLIGGSFGLRGALSFVLMPRPKRAIAGYLALPLATERQAEARVQHGEQLLAQLARQSRRARITFALLSMATALAIVPTAWAVQRRRDPSYRFGDRALDYVGLTISILQFSGELAQLFAESVPEERFRLYRQLRDQPGGLR